MFTVMRYPCLMEDEGRHFFINVYPTKQEAKDWIASQEGEYFRPSDYYIAEGKQIVKTNKKDKTK